MSKKVYVLPRIAAPPVSRQYSCEIGGIAEITTDRDLFEETMPDRSFSYERQKKVVTSVKCTIVGLLLVSLNV